MNASSPGILQRRSAWPHAVRMVPHGMVPAHAAPGWTGTIKLGKSKGKRQQEEAGRDNKPHNTPASRPADIGPVLGSHDLPSFMRPWNAGPLLSSCSSGLVVNAAQGLVLTTAGAVYYAQYDEGLDACVVHIRLPSSAAPPLAARVVAVAQDADLALLALVDVSTAAKATTHPLHAVTWSKAVPAPGTPVVAAGFASSGGTGASGMVQADTTDNMPPQLVVTRGVVSRVDMVQYSHTRTASLLALQVDAAVNTGAWGGGLFDASGRCLGVLLQRSSAESWRARYCPPDRPVEAVAYPGDSSAARNWAPEEQLEGLREGGGAEGLALCAAVGRSGRAVHARLEHKQQSEQATGRQPQGRQPAHLVPDKGGQGRGVAAPGGAVTCSELLSRHCQPSSDRTDCHIGRVSCTARSQQSQSSARAAGLLQNQPALGDGATLAATGHTRDVENVAYVVPAAVVARFLQDLRQNRGVYGGVPQPHFSWQPLTSRVLSAACGVAPISKAPSPPMIIPAATVTAAAAAASPASTTAWLSATDPTAAAAAVPSAATAGDGPGGVRVLQLLEAPAGTGEGPQPGDIISALDGSPVAADGTVQVQEGGASLRLPFAHLLASKHVGQEVTYTVVRGSRTMEAAHVLQPCKPLVPAWPGVIHEAAPGGSGWAAAGFRYPRFACCGPCAFTALTQQLLASLCGSGAVARAQPGPRHQPHAPHGAYPRRHSSQGDVRPRASPGLSSQQLQLLLLLAAGQPAVSKLFGSNSGEAADSAPAASRQSQGREEHGALAEQHQELVVLLPDCPLSSAGSGFHPCGHGLPPGPHLLLRVNGTTVQSLDEAEELWVDAAGAGADVRLDFAGGWVACVPWEQVQLPE